MSEMTIALPDSISEDEARVCLAAKLFELGLLNYASEELTDDLDHARSRYGVQQQLRIRLP